MSHSSDICSPSLVCFHYGIIQFDGEENQPLRLIFFLKGCLYLLFHPGTCYRVFGEDEQEFVILPDRLINAHPKLVTDLEVFRCIPAANIFAFQVSMQPFGKLLVFAGIADKTAIIINRFVDQRMNVGDKGVIDTSTSIYNHYL